MKILEIISAKESSQDGSVVDVTFAEEELGVIETTINLSNVESSQEQLVQLLPSVVIEKYIAPDITPLRIQEISGRLRTIDSESVRPLRAKLSGSSTQYDDDKLIALETEASALRAELLTL